MLTALPPRALINLVCDMTETQGIVNESDIPVIMDQMMNIAACSTELHTLIHSSTITDLLLNALSTKYQKPTYDLATTLDTQGCRAWLWSYIETEGDRAHFYLLQNILHSANQLIAECTDKELSHLVPVHPEPRYTQTKQGFLLHLIKAPPRLTTPFGTVALYPSSFDDLPLSFFECFIKRCQGIFEGTFSSHCLLSSTTLTPISARETAQYIGTQAFIIDQKFPLYGNSTYQLQEALGAPLPPVIPYRNKEAHRSPEVIAKIWEMLSAELQGASLPIPVRKVLKETSPAAPPQFCHILDIIPHVVHLIGEAFKQTPTKGRFNEYAKVLPLETTTLGTFLRTLYNRAKHLETPSLYIQYNPVTNELSLQFYVTVNALRPPSIPGPFEFHDLFSKTIAQAIANWSPARLQDHPLIIDTQSEATHFLFIKEDFHSVVDDVPFLEAGSALLGISKFITISHRWKQSPLDPSPHYAKQTSYLWIRKNKFAEVAYKLNLLV